MTVDPHSKPFEMPSLTLLGQSERFFKSHHKCRIKKPGGFPPGKLAEAATLLPAVLAFHILFLLLRQVPWPSYIQLSFAFFSISIRSLISFIRDSMCFICFPVMCVMLS